MERQICPFCQHDNHPLFKLCGGCGANLTMTTIKMIALKYRDKAEAKEAAAQHVPHINSVPLDLETGIKPNKLYTTANGIHMYSGDEWVATFTHEQWKELNRC